MRLFAAIDIDSGVRDRIAAVEQTLQDRLNLGRQAKWVEPENMHLTLKFLGEVPDDRLTRVCDVLRRVAGQFSSFDFEVRGLGAFGRPARIIWAGTSHCPAMMELQAELETQFHKLGWEKENRPFAGHLTLCRVKTAAAGLQLAKAIEPYENEVFGCVTASEVVLYESRLGSKGPAYTAVSRASLK